MIKRPRKTQEAFEQEVYDLVGDEYIVTGKYVTNKTYIEMLHTTCKGKFKVTPNNFLRKSRCPYCCGSKYILKGYNDMATTAPHLVDLLHNKEDGYKYRSNSNIKLKWVCPHCDSVLTYSPYVVNTFGLRCHNCSDGISYPNKFIHSLFSQLKDDISNYQTEYSPEWIGMKRYDVYFEHKNLKYIVEMDGGLGHGYSSYNNDNNDIKKSIEIDKYKESEALKHNIKVIRIDARYSTLRYIKQSILDSELKDILDLSKINWLKCHLDATTSKKKKIIQLYNSGVKNINDIVDIVENISYVTVYKYLSDASKYGLCDYDPKSYVKYRKINNKHICKKVICLNTLQVYNSLTQAAKENNVLPSGISSCCYNKYKTCGTNELGEKLKWKFYNDYLVDTAV